VHDLPGLVLVAHLHLAEVVLRELGGQPLEAHQRRDHARADGLRQRVQRALAPGVPRLFRTVQQLDGLEGRVLRQGLDQYVAIRLGRRRASHLAPGPLGRVIDRRDRVFLDHPLHRPHGHAAELRHLRQRVAGPPQYLNLVSLEHVDHPFPRRRWSLRRFSGPGGLPAGGQNFRKGCGQNFRNPQHIFSDLQRAMKGTGSELCETS
jgi:hypothetical protein